LDDALVAKGWLLSMELLGAPKDAKASGYSSFCPVLDSAKTVDGKTDEDDFMRCYAAWLPADRLVVGSVSPSAEIANLDRCALHIDAGLSGEGKERKFFMSYTELMDQADRAESASLKAFCDMVIRTNSTNKQKLAMTMWGGSFTFALSLRTTTDYVDMIRATRTWVDEQGDLTPVITDSPYARVVPKLHCWNSGIPFDYWEQYLTIEWVLYRTIIFAVVAAVVVAVFFIAPEQYSAGSPWSHIFSSSVLGAVMIALNIIFSIVTVIGLLAWANVELSALTAMTCLITVGFACEFAVYIVHAFHEARGTGIERADEAMRELFLPMFLSFLASFAGIIFLAISDFGFCVYYVFYPLIIAIMVTNFYAMLFLPVALQLIADAGLVPTYGALEQMKKNSIALPPRRPTISASTPRSTRPSVIGNKATAASVAPEPGSANFTKVAPGGD